VGTHRDAGAIAEQVWVAAVADQHRQAFLLMLTGLAADFDRLVDRCDLYPRLEQLGYAQLALYVDPAELDTIRDGINALLRPHLQEAPGKDRVVLSVIALPDD
jgi:hypothetical protein